MTVDPERQRLVESLLKPSAYPHPAPGGIEHISTHISDVFLAGEFAYKIKKPVNLGFCDFSSRELRERFTRSELERNLDFSHGVYLSVEPVTLDVATGEFAILGDGEVVEVALKMRRLSTEDELGNLIQSGEIGQAQIRQIAHVVARAHATAAPAKEPFGTLETVSNTLLGNLDRVFEHAVPELDRAALQNIAAYTQAYLRIRGTAIDGRRAAGKPRLCHGDLHTGNIFLEPSAAADSGQRDVQIIDTIEFNDNFTYIDPAADLAFLSMDLKRLGHPDLSELLVDEYVAESGDEQLRELLPFYETYRAMVRCMAESIMAKTSNSAIGKSHAAEAVQYLDLAVEITAAERPQFLAITSGVTGTGKSTVARLIADNWNVTLLQSDVIRRELAGIGPTERSGSELSGGIYTPEMSRRTYDEMHRRAEVALVGGESVILDGTHTRPDRRRSSLDIGRAAGVMTLAIECSLSETQAIDRLTRRYASGESESEGRPEVYAAQISDWIPVADDEADSVVRLNTAGDPGELARAVFPAMWDAMLRV